MIRTKIITTILKLVFAELRGSWQRLSFFILCISVGVGAVMSVKSLSASIAGSIERESKSLIASDIEIRGSWPLTDKELRKIDQLSNKQASVQTIVELKAMALVDPRKDLPASSTLVELKAVPINYPYYGKVLVTPNYSFQKLLEGNRALVEDSFLLKNQLKIGDYFQLGESKLRISGVIKREPDRAITFFSFGPRILISSKTLEVTKLIQPGSRIRYRTQLKINENTNLELLLEKIRNFFANSGMKVQSYKQSQPMLRESIKRFELYLGSIGVIAILLGGVGVAMIIRTFLQLKILNIAILKSLGGKTGHIFSVYLIQAIFLGLVGSLLGIIGGFCLQWFIASGITRYLNVSISPQWVWMPALESLTLGLITTFIFTLWPLLKAKRTPPAMLLRQDNQEAARGPQPNGLPPNPLTKIVQKGNTMWGIPLWKQNLKNWYCTLPNFNSIFYDKLMAGVIFGIGLMIITIWQAGSLRAGLIFLSGIIGATAILIFITSVALKILKKLPKSKNICRRYGIANLYRPNSQAISIVTALGVGIMLVLTVRLVQSDLLDFINRSAPVDAPNFFFIDIQPDQVQPFKKSVQKIASARLTGLVPIVRSRLHAVNGKPIKEMKFDKVGTKRFFNREFVLTYTDTLPEENSITQGEWWRKNSGTISDTIPEVSVEKDAAETLGVSLGSHLTLNIQGALVTAKVTSIRRVDWNNRRTNFYMIFSPGSLEGVSHNFVATAQVPKEDELKLQTSVVQSLSNVTAINTRHILIRAQEVVNHLSFLVRILSIFTIIIGLIILSGSIASTKFRRMRETAILKTIGATRKIILRILGYEYILLGLIAGGTGSLLAILFSYGIDKYLVKLDWHFRPLPVTIAIVATIFLVWAVGLISSWNIINNKPLQTLRQDA